MLDGSHVIADTDCYRLSALYEVSLVGLGLQSVFGSPG